MSIIRKKLSFERDKNTFEIPRAWARDKRLHRKARGLLVELLSHSEGFEIKFQHLLAAGPEKRDALNTQLRALEALGYLTRIRTRSVRGTFEVDYELSDPFEEPVDNFLSRPDSTSAENPPRLDLSTAEKSGPLRRDTSLTDEGLIQSHTQPHLGAVDNSEIALRADDEISSSQQLTLTARVKLSRAKRQFSIESLEDRCGHVFAEIPSTDRRRILLAIAYKILGKAATAGTPLQAPTAYVAASIEAEPFVWQKVAFKLYERSW